MCGIAGMVGRELPGTVGGQVRAMTDDLARRGPDAEGAYRWPGAELGHRRLSIFDLSEAGRQPMLTEDGQLGLVFNGAIYNWRDLRSELEQRGYRFRTQTDTEVLLHGYRAWGIDALVRRLRGMFAIALWDEAKATLYLMRDRLGVKPLVYGEQGERLAFASTPRALRAAGWVGDLDPQAVLEYLEFGYVPEPRTIYQGAKKLPAGHLLEWHGGRIVRQGPYWELPEVEPGSRMGFAEAVAETEARFLEAVKLRLDADVPVGALLSGGVDSSLVCWAVARWGANIKAFTVGTPGDPADETADAAATARQLGIEHEVITLTAEDDPEIDQFVAAYGEPFSCSSGLGMLKVARAIKPSATVLLTGDGGDDVFLGYPEHRNFWWAETAAQWIPGPVAATWPTLRRLVPPVGTLRRARHFADYACGGLAGVAGAHDGLPRYQAAGVLGPRLREHRVAQREWSFSPAAGRRVLRDFLAYDRRHRFVGEYMTKVDGATMHYALEARSPFLDHMLWEFAARLPFDVRLQGNTLKAVLRTLARQHIGSRVADGQKRGFTIPVGRWLVGRWRERMDEVAAHSLLAREGWLEGAAFERWWQQEARNGAAAPVQMWHLFVLENWLRQARGASR